MKNIRLLTARDIDCRVAQIKKTGLQLLLYKNARTDMDILDETFGPMNWQRRNTRDNANCIVSIWDDEKKCWIEKEDTGTESNTEAEKGLASDSFKRACVNIGIGRELYTAPFIWITPPNCEIKENNGRFQCYDRFEVQDIGYNDNREINRLVIINSKTRNVVYEYGTRSNARKPGNNTRSDKGEEVQAAQDKPAETMQQALENAAEDMTVRCERCQQAITGVALPGGKTMTAGEIIAKSKMTYNGVYCFACSMDLSKKRKAAENGKRD